MVIHRMAVSANLELSNNLLREDVTRVFDFLSQLQLIKEGEDLDWYDKNIVVNEYITKTIENMDISAHHRNIINFRIAKVLAKN